MRILGTVAVLLLLGSHQASMFQAQPSSNAAASVITEASVRGHMEFLASDAMKGRGSGTEDEWRAAVYIGSQMRRWGIEPLGDNGGFVKQVETGRVSATSAPTLSVGGVQLTHGREILVSSIGLGSVSGHLAMLKPGTPAEAGTFVVVPEGATVAAADIAGAAATIAVETAAQRTNWSTAGARLPGGGRGRGGAPQPIRIAVARDSYEVVAKAAASGASAEFKVDTKAGYTWNAIGQLKGSDPALSSDVILLTAHLDHLGANGPGSDPIFNGADDDASGSTAVLELAEALSRGPRPKRTVMFAWFGSEETGGAGNANFLANPPVPLTQIVANLEFEMIANRDPLVPPHTLWLTGYDCSTLGPDLAKQGAKIVGDPHPTQGFFNRSDNAALARRGIVAQTVSSFDAVASKTYHKVTDEISTVDFAHMTDAIQSMLSPVLWLANSNYKPTWLEGKDPSKNGSCGARQGRGGE